MCLDVCPYRAIKLEDYAGEDGRAAPPHRAPTRRSARAAACARPPARRAASTCTASRWTSCKAQVAAALEDVLMVAECPSSALGFAPCGCGVLPVRLATRRSPALKLEL
ncbi:MAG: hypothetical protein MZV70_48505 [Desulfobacterales bacterium]|nr:hypothetical protein [Desulfobacterales bacterium]